MQVQKFVVNIKAYKRYRVEPLMFYPNNRLQSYKLKVSYQFWCNPLFLYLFL